VPANDAASPAARARLPAVHCLSCSGMLDATLHEHDTVMFISTLHGG
jgi:hypothetical protein